jgi:hypothetical protein
MSRNCARVCVRHVGTGRAEVLDEVDLTGEHGLEALRQRLEQVFAVPVACQRLRAGVPPRLVETAADIQPLDTILLESTVPETPHHRRRSSTNTNTASRNRKRPVGTRGAKQLATDAAIQPAEATAALGTQLVNALSGSAGSAREAQAFRRALREARTEHDQEVRAADRYRAALARSYHVVREESDNADTGASGNASRFWIVQYPKMGARTAMHEDTHVRSLPVDVLREIIREVYGMPPEHRENLRPAKMAQVSPLVFWNVVEYWWRLDHGHQPRLEDALCSLLPTLDWQWLRTRRRTPSQKRFRSL